MFPRGGYSRAALAKHLTIRLRITAGLSWRETVNARGACTAPDTALRAGLSSWVACESRPKREGGAKPPLPPQL